MDDECFRLQGHEGPTYEAVLQQVPDDELQRAGLAGCGVATVVAAEAARRALEAAEAARLRMDTAARRPGATGVHAGHSFRLAAISALARRV